MRTATTRIGHGDSARLRAKSCARLRQLFRPWPCGTRPQGQDSSRRSSAAAEHGLLFPIAVFGFDRNAVVNTNVTLAAGTYIIIAYGAPDGSTFYGTGLGAQMSAEFNFSTSTTLTLLVGGVGGVGYGGGSIIDSSAIAILNEVSKRKRKGVSQ